MVSKMLILHACNPSGPLDLICIAGIIMAHYESNCSDPSDYCHPALPCATKPLNSVLLVQTFSLNSGQLIIISDEEEYILIFVTNSLSDKRHWAGFDQWQYIRRQLRTVRGETTCYNKTPQTQYFREN